MAPQAVADPAPTEKEKEQPAEKEAPAAEPKPAAAPAKAVEAPMYRRPDNLPELYRKYNDLITAVVMRDHDAAKELLADGKNPNSRQSDGQTAIMIATSNGDTEMVKALLAKGADPGLRGPAGSNALSLAKESGNAEMVNLLESQGARP
jgi:hypothetical protein